MARLKLKQVYSNLSYNSGSNQLTVSGSNNTFIISGSAIVTSTPTTTGSFTMLIHLVIVVVSLRST